MKPQEAGGAEAGAGRGGLEPGARPGGRRDRNQPHRRARWPSPGSVSGHLGGEGRKRFPEVPLGLPPAPLLLLEADCTERQEGRMYQTPRRKNPCHSPQLDCGSGSKPINSRLARRRIGWTPKGPPVCFSPQPAPGPGSISKGRGSGPGSPTGPGLRVGAGSGPQRCQTPAERLGLISVALRVSVRMRAVSPSDAGTPGRAVLRGLPGLDGRPFLHPAAVHPGERGSQGA